MCKFIETVRKNKRPNLNAVVPVKGKLMTRGWGWRGFIILSNFYTFNGPWEAGFQCTTDLRFLKEMNMASSFKCSLLILQKALENKQTPSLDGYTDWLGSPESSILLPRCHFAHGGYTPLKHIRVLKHQPTHRTNVFRSLCRKSETATGSSHPSLNQIPLAHGTITGMGHNQALCRAPQRRLSRSVAVNSLAPSQKWNRRNPCILRHS